MMPADPGSLRVILYQVGVKLHVISVSPDADGGYSMALEELLGGPVGCMPLYDDDGIHLCCNRSRLYYGIFCRAILRWLPSRVEVGPRSDNSELDLGPKERPVNGDFLLARIDAGGQLVDLTEDDIRLCMFWLGKC
jgi:hypothetical protein